MGKWNNKCLDDYFDLMHERPNAFTQSPILSIVTDKQRMLTFMESTNKQLGVVYKSPFHLMVVDLIAGVNGQDFAYERLLPTVEKGAVVCLVEYNNKIVLERVFRHAIRKEQLELPRGFGEPNISGPDNVIKECREELSATIDRNSIKFLGSIIADSGCLAGSADVYFCKAQNVIEKFGYEGIKSLEFISWDSISHFIANGGISDGFTLAALKLFDAYKEGCK